MADLALQWGGDLSVSAAGDLAMATDVLLDQQRILRRLLTNAGDYIWQPNYGAGLGQFVGQTYVSTKITGAILSQIFNEAVVAEQPAPRVVSECLQNGVVTVGITYTGTLSGTTQTLSFSLNA